MDSAEAPCRFSDPDLWLSSIRSELSTAIALCRKRSRFHQCLTGALDRQEVAGIWGGRHIVGGELRPFRDDAPLLRRTTPVSCPFESTFEPPDQGQHPCETPRLATPRRLSRKLPVNALYRFGQGAVQAPPPG